MAFLKCKPETLARLCAESPRLPGSAIVTLEAARSDESPLVRAAAFAKVFRWGKGRRSKAELRALAERFLADQEPIPYGGQEHTLGWAEEAWRKAGRPEEDFTPAVLTHFLVRVVLAPLPRRRTRAVGP